MAVAPSPQRHRRRARRPMGAISHSAGAPRGGARDRHGYATSSSSRLSPRRAWRPHRTRPLAGAPGSPSPKPHGRSVRPRSATRHRGSPDRRRGRSRRARIQVALAERPHDHLTTAGVDDDVARHLGDGGRDQRWVRAWASASARARPSARAGTRSASDAMVSSADLLSSSPLDLDGERPSIASASSRSRRPGAAPGSLVVGDGDVWLYPTTTDARSAQSR